jgi:hypothetical protein
MPPEGMWLIEWVVSAEGRSGMILAGQGRAQRSVTMMRHDAVTIDRRLAIGGGLAAATGLAWPRLQARGRVVTQRGITGGGRVEFDAGEAQFSLFVSSLVFDVGEGDGDLIFAGSVLWVDPTVGLTMESTQITNYENQRLPDAEGRLIEGLMDVGDAGEHPFRMEVVNVGPPGSEADRVILSVGTAAGESGAATPAAGETFTYAADGVVVTGDVREVNFAVDLDAGTVSEPPPA